MVYLFIYLFLAMLGLRCYVGFSLVVVRGDYSSVAVTPSGFSLQQVVQASKAHGL